MFHKNSYVNLPKNHCSISGERLLGNSHGGLIPHTCLNIDQWFLERGGSSRIFWFHSIFYSSQMTYRILFCHDWCQEFIFFITFVENILLQNIFLILTKINVTIDFNPVTMVFNSDQRMCIQIVFVSLIPPPTPSSTSSGLAREYLYDTSLAYIISIFCVLAWIIVEENICRLQLLWLKTKYLLSVDIIHVIIEWEIIASGFKLFIYTYFVSDLHVANLGIAKIPTLPWLTISTVCCLMMPSL